MRTTTTALLAVAALGVGACGDSASDDQIADFASQTPATTAAPATTTTTAATSTVADSGQSYKQLTISKNLKKKPAIGKPSGDPPSTLYMRDVVKGKGKKAKTGDNVSMQYVGTSFSTGEQFDASWDRDQPFDFQLGKHAVIAGWDQGIPGMRVGGRRLLVIPPDLGYGSQGQGTIAPDETLLFVVDLKKVS